MRGLRGLLLVLIWTTLAGWAAAEEPKPAVQTKCYVSEAYLEAYRGVVRFYNPRLEPQTVDVVVHSILWYSDMFKVDPRLVVAVVATESRFQPKAVSRHGAQGLGQLMPGTASMYKVDAFEPYQNIQGTVQVLKLNLDRFKHMPLDRQLEYTLAAYNAGYGAVLKYDGVPPYGETRDYVRKVVALYKHLSSQDQDTQQVAKKS